jgi:hypothetical protein
MATQDSFAAATGPPAPTNARKRKSVSLAQSQEQMAGSTSAPDTQTANPLASGPELDVAVQEPKIKKSRTNTPWTPAEEQRLKQMRDTGNSWSEIAKVEAQIHATLSQSPTHMLLRRDLVMKYRATNPFRPPDLPPANRRQCQEALVQGRWFAGRVVLPTG